MFPGASFSGGQCRTSALQQRWLRSSQKEECCSEEWMHPQVQGKGSQCSLLFVPPHMKFSDYGAPKASWSGAFGAVGVCVSGALFFLSLHCPPQIELWQLWDVPST